MECSFCRRGFSKGEHLRRHERSHAGTKPFQCQRCNKSYSRQDSLARHEKLHLRGMTPERDLTPPTITEKPATFETVSNGGWTRPSQHQAFDALDFTSVSQSEANLQPTPSPDFGFDLFWPDSEDLLQTLLEPECSSQWQMSVTPSSVHTDPRIHDVLSVSPGSFDERPPSIAAIPPGANSQAVHDVSRMISNFVGRLLPEFLTSRADRATQSATVTAAASSTSITSVFLDEALHMFFVKFIPTFPILHRATFVFRDCSHPLLLNAIAIGSLYLGHKDAMTKGETLWQLAHTAVTTSWQTLIRHRGPYDACDGVQLLVAYVLCQLYGALSRSHTIRSMSQAFHPLGFMWARQCGMLDCEPWCERLKPSPEAASTEKDRQWRVWVAREIQHRALLAQYIMDGLMSQMSGEPASLRHTTNELTQPSTEAAFEAATADDWIYQIQHLTTSTTSFRSTLRRLFDTTKDLLRPDMISSAFSYKVILEGLQYLIPDDTSEQDMAVGVPVGREVLSALKQLYESITTNTSLSCAERHETLLRWHNICLDTRVGSSSLGRALCGKYNIKQYMWQNRHISDSNIDLALWVTAPAGRSALLHAMAIQEIVEQLPRGRAHAIHMPSSLFATAAVYSAFALGRRPAIKVPTTVIWQDVLMFEASGPHPHPQLNGTTRNETATARYIRGEDFAASNATARNLLYELNSVQMLFHCLVVQWGVATDMENIVEKWIDLCPRMAVNSSN